MKFPLIANKFVAQTVFERIKAYVDMDRAGYVLTLYSMMSVLRLGCAGGFGSIVRHRCSERRAISR